MSNNGGPALFGYASQFSVANGESLTFHVSGEHVSQLRAQLVRLRHGLEKGPGFQEIEIESAADGDYPCERQPDNSGSFIEVRDTSSLLAGHRSLSLSLSLFPTLLESGVQGVIGQWDASERRGYAVVIHDGHLALWTGDGTSFHQTELPLPLETHTWYQVDAGYDLDRQWSWVEQRPLAARGDRVSPSASTAMGSRIEGSAPTGALHTDAPFLMAALSEKRSDEWAARDHYNGKIGDPVITTKGTTLAQWDFAASTNPDGALLDDVVDVSPNGLHGICVNTPQRGVTGASWDGMAEDYRQHPEHYGAMHFHEDDIDDARWPVAFEFAPPAELPSGVYAFRLTGGGAEEHISFIVRPGAGQARAPVALLMPTGSYLAYANDHLPFDAEGAELLAGHVPVLHEEDFALQRHYDFGRSCYEVHPDGSGVIFSTRRRPILNMRPRYCGWFMAEAPWQFPGDLCIVDWLDEQGVDYDVICDEDLHREGYDLLEPYQVVLTGSHPEYASVQEMDALETYVGAGGRLMYLGGNGFYWLVSYHPQKPYLMEIRRSENGSRPHAAWPGEHHHQTTGETCGMWRSKGRAPQRLLGVGMGSEGFDRSAGYQRMPDSHDPAADFIFDGVTGEQFGDYGLMGGGAAGAELDRYDVTLGSPPETLLLASSVGLHSDNYQQVSEDLLETPPTTGGSQSLAVRSDVVYLPLSGGGAVFSVGSIAWTGALSHNGYDNDIARITENVLRHFLDERPLPPRTS